MVTIAEELNTLYPVNNNKPIFLKGFVSGNFGEFNRHWLNTTSANIKPGHGLLRAVSGAEHTCTEWGQHCIVGYGVAGWDKTQVATQQTAYGSGDLIPVYPFHENPGAIFQGYVTDSGAAINADVAWDAGAVGVFEVAGADFRNYAATLYYIADTGASYDNVIVFYVADSGAVT